MTEDRQRLWLGFAVDGTLRWLGHLDLFRAWERVLRRAGLPVLYSQGFNPRPRMAIAQPLPLGFAGEAELLDLLLSRPVPPLEVARRVRRQLPGGLTLHSVEEVALKAPSLQSQLEATEYIVRLGIQPEDLAERVHELLSTESCLRQRRGRPYDLRPLIQVLSVEESGELTMVLQAGDQGTARPDEVLLALGLDPLSADIRRRRLRLRLASIPERPAG
jgi:radical SAM-linked protein